jgi:hypothetical protein
VRQLVPLLLTAPTLVALVWYAVAPGHASVLAFRLAALALIVSGAAGIYLHDRGNMEFQLELDPSLTGLALARKVLHAKSPPTLPPGQMALLGSLGLAATYRQKRDASDEGG